MPRDKSHSCARRVDTWGRRRKQNEVGLTEGGSKRSKCGDHALLLLLVLKAAAVPLSALGPHAHKRRALRSRCVDVNL